MAYVHGDMHGKFFMSDVYGGVFGTTEMTIPEAADKQALVDDPQADVEVSTSSVNYKGIVGAVILVACLALILGGLK